MLLHTSVIKVTLKASLVILAVTLPSLSAFAETRGFAINMLHTATYADKRNCPRGGNGHYGQTRIRTYKLLGLSQERIDYLLSGKVRLIGLPSQHLVTMRGKKDGQLVSAYHYPESVPMPDFETVVGPHAYGFDLDGANSDGFEDPETGERGVDNQLFRTVGCFELYSVGLPARPFYEETIWTTLIVKQKPPAWVFTVSGDDLSKDGEVTVSFYSAVEHLRLDTTGKGLADVTYVIDPAARTHGVFRGELKQGVFTSYAGDEEFLLERQFSHTKLDLTKARLRLTLNDDHTAAGYLGGYQPWMDFWFMLAAGGEQDHGLDISAIYQMLKRMADGRPDPESGENTGISGAYRVEAVPAFLATADGRFITDVQ